MKKIKKIRVLELFSGYGGASWGLNKIGIPHEVIGYSDIDKGALKITNINFPELADKSLGDVTKIDEKQLPDFDLITSGFPCFLAGTLITTQRGHIPIEDVVVNDIVLTHKNRWRKVIDTMSHKRDHYYNVKFQGSHITQVTGNHEFFSKKMIQYWDGVRHSTPKRVFSEGNEWISVENMRKDDFVALGTWNKRYENKHNLTNEECWLIGRYVADGHIGNAKRKNRKNSYNHRVSFSVGKAKQKEFLKVANKSEYYIGMTETPTVYSYRIINERFMNLCLECGKGAVNKKIPFFIMNLPKNKLEHFLNGYMSGDGCFTADRYSATSVSKQLIFQLGQVVHRLYKTVYNITFYKRPKTTIIEGRIVNQRDLWRIAFDKKIHKQDNSVWINNNMYGRFVKKERINKRVRTYNITVEEDHSYVANNMIAKNCQSFSIAGKREGFAALNKGKLFFDIIRIAEYKKPRWMLLENVQGLLSHDYGKTFEIVISELKRIGYYVRWKLLKSKEHGTPQNRPRVWIACFRNVDDYNKFAFPQKEKLVLTVKDLLEDDVDKKYFLTKTQLSQFNKSTRYGNHKLNYGDIVSSTLLSIGQCDVAIIPKDFKIADFRGDDGFRVRKNNILSPTLLARERNDMYGIPVVKQIGVLKQKVSKRSFETSKEINQFLKNHKKHLTVTNIATSLDISKTQVEHYFRIDSSRAIPSPEVWFKLKELLDFDDRFDEAVTNYYEKESEFESTQRVYDANGVSPTITSTNADKIFNNNEQWRRLTPRECFRLMGFFNDEIQFGNIKDSKLYFLAGNGWDISLVSKIFKQMFLGNNNDQKLLDKWGL